MEISVPLNYHCMGILVAPYGDIKNLKKKIKKKL